MVSRAAFRTAETALLSFTFQSSPLRTSLDRSFSAFLSSISSIFASRRVPWTQSQRQPSVGHAPSDKTGSANHVERQFACPPCPQSGHHVHNVAVGADHSVGTDGDGPTASRSSPRFWPEVRDDRCRLCPLSFRLERNFDLAFFAVSGSKAGYLAQQIGHGACVRLHDSHRILSLGLLIGDLQLRHSNPSCVSLSACSYTAG